MVEVAFFAFGTGLGISVDAAVLDFTGDGSASVFDKIKATITFVTRILPMISFTVGDLELVRNRRAPFTQVLQEEPWLA
jgi:hypothetical protein